MRIKKRVDSSLEFTGIVASPFLPELPAAGTSQERCNVRDSNLDGLGLRQAFELLLDEKVSIREKPGQEEVESNSLGGGK